MSAFRDGNTLLREPENLVAAEEWESRWQRLRYPLRLDFRSPGVRALTDFCSRVLPHGERTVIEVGCGASAWLPFFSQELGYRVHGIDYSPTGVSIARKNLEVLEIDGRIIEGDLFDPTLLPSGSFDVVFSSGFIEHFPDTNVVLTRMRSLLKSGGMMVTVVPNLHGSYGVLQKLINRPVFDQHVVMDASYLERSHREAGLETIAGPAYLGGFDLWALTWDTWLRGRSATFRRLFGKSIAAINLAMNLGARLCGASNGRLVSQMIVIASRKGVLRHDAP